MLKFVIRRILWTIPVILLVILFTFVMMKQIKGNPFQTTDRAVPESIQRNLERKFHLDKPWHLQYLYYVQGVASFDLGPSLVQRNRDVNDIIKHFPVSLKLGLLAMLWAVIVGIPLGVISALKQNTIVDYVTMVFVNLGYAIPNFLVCTLLIYFFAVKWGDITGFPTNGIEAGWKSWVLPAIALGHAPMTLFARIVRGSMLETLQQDYIRTAKAKGLRRRRVVGLHVLRNSLIPAVTAAAPLLGFLITGSFIVEFIFGIPGIGRYFVISVTGRDYSVTMGITVMLAVIIIFANLVVDILYGFLDPRTRDVRV
jgi:ABC-type dipeptide/oligopeptide/nickel transport system permease component